MRPTKKFVPNLHNGLTSFGKNKKRTKKQKMKLKEFTTKARRKELVKVRK